MLLKTTGRENLKRNHTKKDKLCGEGKEKVDGRLLMRNKANEKKVEQHLSKYYGKKKASKT